MQTITLPRKHERGQDCWCRGLLIPQVDGTVREFHNDAIGAVLAMWPDPWVIRPKDTQR